MKPAVGERVFDTRHGYGVVKRHTGTVYSMVLFEGRTASLMCSHGSLSPAKHEPYTTDGLEYCGWTTEAGTFGGCGFAWPCPGVAPDDWADVIGRREVVARAGAEMETPRG